MKIPVIVALAIGLAVALFGPGETPVAQAASFTVNSETDAVDANPGDGACATASLPTEGVRCTLRAAIMEANALAGPDQVNVPAGTFRITITGANEDVGARGDFDVTSELTLTGAGNAATFIDGNSAFGHDQSTNDRVFDVLPAGNATIQDVTIQHGVATFGGGGIRNQGTVTLLRSVIVSNVAATRHGAGVLTSGTMTIVDSVIRQNVTVMGGGGGVLNTGTLAVRTSTIIGNGAQGLISDSPIGGGVLNIGTLTLDGVTISGNLSKIGGGGLDNEGQVTVTNSTISGNSSLAGSGSSIFNGGQAVFINATIVGNSDSSSILYNFGAASDFSLKNTIVTNTGSGPNCNAPIQSEGNNIDSGDSCALKAPGDLPNTAPVLGPLTSNGGLTFTHDLQPGSPAIDAGTNAGCPSTDQRGHARPIDGNGDGIATCDIGAVEVLTGGIPPARVCAPRPTVAMRTTQIGPGKLQAMLTVGRTALQPNNTLQSVQVTRLDNATVTVNGAAMAIGQTAPLSAGTTQAQIVVTRTAPGPFTARLAITDDCGAWPTFVGGGAGVP